MQEETPRTLEDKIALNGGKALELFSQCEQVSRIEWRALRDVLRVQCQELVHLCCGCADCVVVIDVFVNLLIGTDCDDCQGNIKWRKVQLT